MEDMRSIPDELCKEAEAVNLKNQYRQIIEI